MSLLRSDAVRDVLIQVFSGARNNPAIQTRLQQFLNDQADQLSGLIERGKQEQFANPNLTTVALTLLCQAIGIGTHLLVSAGLDDRHIPPEQEWATLLEELVGLAFPRGNDQPSHD